MNQKYTKIKIVIQITEKQMLGYQNESESDDSFMRRILIFAESLSKARECSMHNSVVAMGKRPRKYVCVVHKSWWPTLFFTLY